MTTPTYNQIYNADTTRTAVLHGRPARRRTTTDFLQMLAELDETSVKREFDREPRHTAEDNFAPTCELSNAEKVALIISDTTKPKPLEALLMELSKVEAAESNPDYASYEIEA